MWFVNSFFDKHDSYMHWSHIFYHQWLIWEGIATFYKLEKKCNSDMCVIMML